MDLLSTASQGRLNPQAVIRLNFLSCLLECTLQLHSAADGKVAAGGKLCDCERSKHYIDTTLLIYSRTGLTNLFNAFKASISDQAYKQGITRRVH